MSGPRFKVIDLFSGAGGLTLGFSWAGFEPILGVERERDFAETYAANFGSHIVACDIESVVGSGCLNLKTDVVIGGPPCQGFSNLTGNKADDPRRALWRYFMDVVEQTDAKVFVCENVPNMITSPEGQSLIERARKLGFHISDDSVGVLLASNFGVPQNRKRGFIIGSRLGPVSFPSPSGEKVSVREAFEVGLHPSDQPIPLQPLHRDLIAHPAKGSDLHIARNPTKVSLKRYRLIPEGGNRFDLQRLAPELTPDCWIRKKSGGTDLFGRLEYDGPARCTIRTEFYKPEKGRYLHPEAHRPITHWEAARLQSFPDEFKWCGTKIRIAIQIGNAVPPRLSEAIGRQVREHLLQHRQRPVSRPNTSVIAEMQKQMQFSW